MQGGSIVAAYGSGITEDWLTTGVCFDTVSLKSEYLLEGDYLCTIEGLNKIIPCQYAAASTTVQVRHQSGGSSDCIEYTGWPHNKFTVHTIANGSQ